MYALLRSLRSLRSLYVPRVELDRVDQVSVWYGVGMLLFLRHINIHLNVLMSKK